MAQQARRLGITPETIAYRIKNGFDPLMAEKLKKKNYGRTVLQKDLGGRVVCTHASLPEASKGFNNPRAALKSIWRVLDGRRLTYLGYCWEYAPLET